jgi:hypothetical protein
MAYCDACTHGLLLIETKRVQAAIRKLNYRPNLAAQMLRTMYSPCACWRHCVRINSSNSKGFRSNVPCNCRMRCKVKVEREIKRLSIMGDQRHSF